MIAGCHSRAYAGLPGVEVAGVCDERPLKAEQLAATTGAAVVPDLEALLDLDLDVVSVCTPPDSHVDLTLRSLEAGCSVLCEKPVARDLADARRLLAAARDAEAAGQVVAIGHVARFEAEHAAAQRLVADGMVGRVAMMTHSMTSAFPPWSEGGWLADPERSGGPLLDLAVHSFDYLAWVSGARAVRVHAVAGDTPVGPTTYALATVRYDNGAMAQVQASWANPASRGFRLDCELVGTDGRVSWDYDSIRNGELHGGDGSSEVFFPLGERGYAAELAAFTEAARAGGPSPVPVEAGYEALRTALAAHRSLATGQPVDLTTWEAA
jgi:myo-inositol 2-dehydrogenase/D-chiro-inositol 1-dehydrogenase